MCIVLQKGLDKEFFLLFSVMDENMSWYLEENIEKFSSNETDLESNLMHGINHHCVVLPY